MAIDSRKEKRDFSELALVTAIADGGKGGREAFHRCGRKYCFVFFNFLVLCLRPALRMVFLSLGCFL